MDDMKKHATTLADYLTFGTMCKFGVHNISKSGAIINGAETVNEPFIAVYPVEFDGMGGGMFAASMEEAPIYEFGNDDADYAGAFCAALNFFASNEDESS
jgi:hypothetical protein